MRPYPGLAASIGRLRDLLAGSYLWDEGAARNLQDPLTFRNMAHVHGAARDALGHADAMLAIELNASQQNPLLVLEDAGSSRSRTTTCCRSPPRSTWCGSRSRRC